MMKKIFKPAMFIILFTSFVFILFTGCKKDEDGDDYPATVTDADGNTYNTVKIGEQVWTKENLRTTKFNNGTAISHVTDQAEWGGLNAAAYCWYNNNQSAYGATYGAFYNWYAVKNGNPCPTGWHVPTDNDWTTLVNTLGGDSLAGGKMKETSLWLTPNTGATNETGFSAVPGGYRFTDGEFYSNTEYCYFWSASEFNSTDGLYRLLYYNTKKINKGNLSKKYGFSVRCIMD